MLFNNDCCKDVEGIITSQNMCMTGLDVGGIVQSEYCTVLNYMYYGEGVHIELV